MKWRLVPYEIPKGNLIPGAAARLRSKVTGQTVAATTAGVDGVIEFTLDGHPGPVYVDMFRNGFQYVGSNEPAGPVGVNSLAELPELLYGAFGDTVFRGVLSEWAITSGWTSPTNTWDAAIAPGAMLVRGVPFVNYTYDLFKAAPATLGRIDRVFAKLTRTGSYAGKMELTYVGGVDASVPSAPAATQDADTWMVPLYRLTFPAGGGAPVVLDEREFIYDSYRSRPDPVSAKASSADLSTASTTGAQLLGSTITLPSGVEGLVIVDVEGEVTPTSTSYPWEYSFGSFGSGTNQFNSPHDIAFSPDGTKAYIADLNNSRLVYCNYAGGVLTWVRSVATPGPCVGVCTDATGDVYAAIQNTGVSVGELRRFSADLLTMEFNNYTGGGSVNIYGICTNGASVWRSTPGIGYIGRHSASTLSQFSSTNGWGAPRGICLEAGHLWIARGNGSLIRAAEPNTPTLAGSPIIYSVPGQLLHGIVGDGSGHLYFAAGDNVIRKITTGGALLATIGSTGSGAGQFNAPRGVDIDPFGDLWVVDAGNNRLQRLSIAPSFDGVGSIAAEIDGLVSGYIGLNTLQSGRVANRATAVITGNGSPRSVSIYGKAGSGTFRLKNARLDARVITRR